MTKLKKKKTWKVLLVIGVNAILVVVLVLAAEFFLSFFVSRPVDTLVSHPRLNHMIKPYSQETHREWIAANPEFPDAYTHVRNGQGWLETYDVEKAKSPNTYRIFYLGDSFTEGTCEMDQSVPSLIESGLNAPENGDDFSFEVINTGTASYSPTIYYVLARYFLLDYDPDLIVVDIDMTDDFDDWKYAQLQTVDDDGNPLAVSPVGYFGHTFTEGGAGVVPATARERVQLFLSRYSYIYNTLDRVKSRLGIAGTGSAAANEQSDAPANTRELYQRWSWCKDEWDDVTEDNVNHTLDLLRRLATLCKEHNVKLMFTAVPHYKQYAGSDDGEGKPRWSSRPHVEIGKLAQEVGVPYLNSFEAMAQVVKGTAQSEFYYKNDMHFNPRGYAAWAACHLKFLTDRDNALLPDEFLAKSEVRNDGMVARAPGRMRHD